MLSGRSTNFNALRLAPSCINISWSALQQHVLISNNSRVRKNYFLNQAEFVWIKCLRILLCYSTQFCIYEWFLCFTLKFHKLKKLIQACNCDLFNRIHLYNLIDSVWIQNILHTIFDFHILKKKILQWKFFEAHGQMLSTYYYSKYYKKTNKSKTSGPSCSKHHEAQNA